MGGRTIGRVGILRNVNVLEYIKLKDNVGVSVIGFHQINVNYHMYMYFIFFTYQ